MVSIKKGTLFHMNLVWCFVHVKQISFLSSTHHSFKGNGLHSQEKGLANLVVGAKTLGLFNQESEISRVTFSSKKGLFYSVLLFYILLVFIFLTFYSVFFSFLLFKESLKPFLYFFFSMLFSLPFSAKGFLFTLMFNHLFSWFIVTLWLFSSVSCHQIEKAEELIALFSSKTVSVVNESIELLCDLDFSKTGLTLPLGVSSPDCVPYSGVFHGNDHSIKGLTIDSTKNQKYSFAGLFCGLENATVKNLVIDSSCSFIGTSAGALSVYAAGESSVINVTNKAVVNGNSQVGGFFAYLNGNSLLFEKCTNDGNITGSDSNVGGFIGYISGISDMIVTISDSTNSGNVTGSKNYVGGFIGSAANNPKITITITNSVNTGVVNGIQGNVGGFIGSVNSGNISIIKCVNSGFVKADQNAGGFIGTISGSNVDVVVFSCMNNETTIGGSNVGGMVGLIYGISSSSVSVTIISSGNQAGVSSERTIACGVFCVDQRNNNVNTTILNSMNKGSVIAKTYAYGIANNVTTAKSVVNIGEVSGDMKSFYSWEANVEKKLFFGLTEKCMECEDGERIEHDNTRNFYKIVGSEVYVHEQLSDESVKENYGMMWSSELDLVIKPVVFVHGLFENFYVVEQEVQLGNVANLSDYFDNNSYGIVNRDSKTGAELHSTDVVMEDIHVIVGEWVNVSVGAPFHDCKQMVPGETLEQLAGVFNFSLDSFIIVDNDTNGILREPWVLETSVSLRLCHNLIVSGKVAISDLVEHGTTLAKIEKLSRFFNESFIVFNASNPDIVFGSNTPVETSMNVIVLNVSRQEIIVVIDDGITNVSVDDIKDAITDVIVVPDGEHVWVDVVSEGDGSFRISVIQTDGVTDSVSDLLKECLKHKS